MSQKALFGVYCNKIKQSLSEIPKKTIAAAYCSTLAAYRPKMQHIGFLIESCIKWAENDYLGHSIIGEGNYYPNTQKKTTAAAYCCILAAYRSKMQHTGSFIDWTKNHNLGHFTIEKGNYYPKYPKKPLLAAYCCIIAAYQPKMQHIGFFIENCIKWAKNHCIGHFIIGEGKYYPNTPKKTPLLHPAAYLQHTGQKCSILDFLLIIGPNGPKIIIWDI